MHRGGKLSGGQTRWDEKVAVHEYLSNVCGEESNGEEHKNQCGLLASVMKSRLSPCKEFFAVSERGAKDRNTLEKVALQKAKTAGEGPQLPRKPRQSLRQGRQETPVPVMQPVQIVERPLGPLEAIIDKELERSCVEMSERALADEAITDSSTAERKVRQQVEQRLGRTPSSRRCRTGGGD